MIIFYRRREDEQSAQSRADDHRKRSNRTGCRKYYVHVRLRGVCNDQPINRTRIYYNIIILCLLCSRSACNVCHNIINDTTVILIYYRDASNGLDLRR